MYMFMYIHIYIYKAQIFKWASQIPESWLQGSSKGGAVETGCSDLYDVIY